MLILTNCSSSQSLEGYNDRDIFLAYPVALLGTLRARGGVSVVLGRHCMRSRHAMGAPSASTAVAGRTQLGIRINFALGVRLGDLGRLWQQHAVLHRRCVDDGGAGGHVFRDDRARAGGVHPPPAVRRPRTHDASPLANAASRSPSPPRPEHSTVEPRCILCTLGRFVCCEAPDAGRVVLSFWEARG